MPFALGKKPAREDPRTLKLSNYTVTLPTPTKIFGYCGLYNDWGMLGNDNYGDCVFAGAAHETMMWNKLRHGVDVPMSKAMTLLDYHDVTGFTPADPGSDNGADMLSALQYRRSTGIRDADGGRHKVAAYVALEPGNFAQAMQATYIFGAIGIGFLVPDFIWDLLDAGEYLDAVDNNASIIGGHYVPSVGTRNVDARVTFITWGQRWQMTKRFYEQYVDEAYVMLSEEQIRADGTGIHGLNLQQLNDDLAAI